MSNETEHQAMLRQAREQAEAIAFQRVKHEAEDLLLQELTGVEFASENERKFAIAKRAEEIFQEVKRTRYRGHYEAAYGDVLLNLSVGWVLG